ncbi:putative F-box protein PP2-B12 isoform X1 [Camellia sinensis]|uniref:putative F-box protein PP2-B12 isoform X1 n=1 Tax=Camellia sinensis TaxID=4442 RepID=UPI001036286F|nr:putative F-box protein PP2-B12 isoform X1 [Camellia sinensis]
MDYLSSLPEALVSEILVYLKSPRDVCRSSAISWGFKSAADSDAVWDRYLPSDYREIISRSVSPLDFSSKKHLYFLLADSPLLIDGGKLSFSLDKESRKKCYMLGARGLTIVWGDTPIYWAWRSLPWGSLPQSSFSTCRFSEVAELVSVCWLDIKGKIETRLLSPKTTYVAFLVFKFVQANQGFESLPAKASVRLVGDEEEKSSTVYLKQPLTPVTSEGLSGRFPQERKDKWMEIQLGEFFNDQGDDGEVVMQLMEIERGNWKYGLVVEGIEIRPKIDT